MRHRAAHPAPAGRSLDRSHDVGEVVRTPGPRDPLRLLALGVVGVVLLAVVVVAGGAVAVRDDGGEPPPAASSDQVAARDARPASPQADRVPAEALLPDLVSLPAEELGLRVRDGGERVLRFAAVLANVGDGPLQVDPVPVVDCPAGQRLVVQTVYLDGDGDARYARDLDRGRTQLPGGCMLFHRSHDHWHFDGSAGYALTSVNGSTPIVERSKVSFCLRDSERNLTVADRDARAYPSCARDRRQGISVGWADRYDATLAGQRLRLPATLPDGPYCLRLTADPDGRLTESDEANNASAIVVRLAGADVRRDPAGSCSP